VLAGSSAAAAGGSARHISDSCFGRMSRQQHYVSNAFQTPLNGAREIDSARICFILSAALHAAPVFIDDDEGCRAEFQHFAELSLVFGDLHLRHKGGI
jgi:hypothetical protein